MIGVLTTRMSLAHGGTGTRQVKSWRAAAERLSNFCSKHNFQLCGQGWAKWSPESGEEGANEEVQSWTSEVPAEGLSMDKEERGSQAEDDEVDAKNYAKYDFPKRKQLLSKGD